MKSGGGRFGRLPALDDPRGLAGLLKFDDCRLSSGGRSTSFLKLVTDEPEGESADGMRRAKRPDPTQELVSA